MNGSTVDTCHMFVDEAGDTTIFGKRGKVLVGQEGCSKYFMVGVACVANPHQLCESLVALRKNILADEYLNGVPSVKERTARAFHAKNDCPEVRRDVFGILKSLEDSVHVYVIFRRKSMLANLGLEARRLGTKIDLNPNRLYDGLVTKLFGLGVLSLGAQHEITFAKRGNKARIKALADALEHASNHGRNMGFDCNPYTVRSAMPSECAGLQVVDYYLWAVQRFYELHEARYFDYIKNSIKVVYDVDQRNDGRLYVGDTKPTLDEIRELEKHPLVG